MRIFPAVSPTAAEVARPLPGDELVPADVVMDRGFTLPAAPEQVWPWLVQVGKGRAGWYFPAYVERLVPASSRGFRRLDPALQEQVVGSTFADWGGPRATFTVAAVEQPRLLLYRSQRGRTAVSWVLVLNPVTDGTRVHTRLRMGPVRRVRLAERLGGAFDEATIAGLAAGLRERLSPPRAP